MKKSLLYGAVFGFVLILLIPIPPHGELVDNGSGLIYDTVLDVTWAQPEAMSPAPGVLRTWDAANT